MGVKGLQYFMENCCPETCVKVDLRKMAIDHMNAHPGTGTPTLVVDGPACLRFWYTCQAWVHGGQWREYLHLLKEFVDCFAAAGIRLVFFFDGVVEESKRAEWVRRRLRANCDVAELFHHLKCHGQQPGRDMFTLPSGLATFSRFALKSLGQETQCSVREGDYESASYARRHNCMGILGQDTDFVIYDTVPYLSVSKLRLDSMTTVLFSREKLCRVLQLGRSDLPLLACILGNDVVPEHRMQRLRGDTLTTYRRTQQRQSQGEKVFAVANFVSGSRPVGEGSQGISSLPLPVTDREVLEKGVRCYLLPGQRSPWLSCSLPSSEPVSFMEGYVSADILQAAKEKHVRAECFMVYNVLYDGVVECSNTLEDEEEDEIPPQAIVYQPIREHIYSILFSTRPDSTGPTPSVKEWFVFPGNPLKDAHTVSPKPLNQSGETPELKVLWFGKGPEVKSLCLSTFLAVFDLEEFTVEYEHLDSPLMAVLCLVTYIAIHVRHLSLEDIDAYLSQAVCVQFKSYTELLQTRVSEVDPRAVQLGSLLVRGLTYVAAANSTCGCPFPMDDLMPWKTFDGLLFHSKYLLAHAGRPAHELLEGNAGWTSLFLSQRELVLGACSRRGRHIQSHARRAQPGMPVSDGERWRERRPQPSRASGQSAPPPQNYRPQPRGPRAHGQEHSYRPRSRHPNRQRYHLAPSWPQHPRPAGP